MAQDGGESDGKGGLLSIRVKKLGIVDSEKKQRLKIYIKRVNCDRNIQNRTLREKLVTFKLDMITNFHIDSILFLSLDNCTNTYIDT